LAKLNGCGRQSRSTISGHESSFCAFGAENVRAVRYESFADERGGAQGTSEALIMPMAIFETNELCAADAGDGFYAGGTALRKQFTVAVGAVRLLILRCESLAGQRGVAISAHKTFAMPWFVLVGHSSGVDHFFALATTRGELLLVALRAKDLIVLGNEALRSDRRATHRATETLVVPLFSLVLHLLHAGAENLAAAITTSRECLVVAVRAKYAVVLRPEWLVDQREMTHAAIKTRLVPMTVFV